MSCVLLIVSDSRSILTPRMLRIGSERDSLRRKVLRAVVLCGIIVLVFGIITLRENATPASKIQKTTKVTKVSAVRNMSKDLDQRAPSGLTDENKPSEPAPTDRKPSGSRTETLQKGMEAVGIVPLRYPFNRAVYNRTILDEESIKQKLLPQMVPTNVNYLWCGENRWFEFNHYLSVLSVLKNLQPDRVVIHYQHPPARDKMLYNLWLDDLKRDYPFFILQPMSARLLEYCAGDAMLKRRIVLELLNVDGGFFLAENTWLLNITPQDKLQDMEIALSTDNGAFDGFAMMRAGLLDNNRTEESVMTSGQYRVKQSQCGLVHHVYNANGLPIRCVIVKGAKYDRFWPMHIWDLDDPFGRLARKIFYGTEKILKPEPSYDTLVPNIAHMVWIGGGQMDFVFYLSVLSLLFVAKVDTVFIHGDLPIPGDYWQTLTTYDRTKDRVRFITRSPPSMIYQGVIEPWYRSLMSDLIRVDLMIKYGGIYTDTDAIWVKPLTYEDRGYDAVASFDWVDWSWPYPDSVNFGISYGKKNAPFWQIFRESMRELHNEHHGFTGVMMPYRLLEKYPHLLRIDRHLQVICYQFRCHPIWVNDYHNMSIDHLTSGSLNNWREDVSTIHWTHPNPPELANKTTLMSSTGMFADLGRMVLEKAGLL